MKLTIKEIAKMAGVSPGTVSKVINNTGSIGAKTKEKIHAIINETGYQPSFSAKSLATKRSNLIAMIYAGEINADFNHPFFNEVINSFKKIVGRLGYDILVFSNEKFKQGTEDYLARCKHFQVDGCIVIAGDHIEEAIYKLDQSDIPCVGIDIQLSGPRSSFVTTDNYKVGAKVVEHLYLQSIKDIAFIGGPDDSAITNIRQEGFVKTMTQLGIPINQEWIRYGDYFEESGYLVMKSLLKEPYLPQAVFAASDMMALGALRALREEGIHVPQQMKIIGCDDIEACRYSSPSLTTVRQDKEKVGRLAATMLHDLIEGVTEPRSILVDPELIIRESCGIDDKK